MSRLLNLILNENMKIFRRLRTWLTIAILIVITAAVLFFSEQLAASQPNGGGDWRTGVQQEIVHDRSMLAKNGLPDQEKAELERKLLVNQYRLAHDLPPAGHTLWGSVLTASHLMILVTIFTVIAAADTVAGEFSGGTIKLLLIRPASRSAILLSKYVSALLFSLTLFLILFATAFTVSGMMNGFHDVGAPHLYTGEDGGVKQANMVRHVLGTYGYQGVQLLMIVTLAFMISTVFRSSSLAIACSIGIMFIGSIVAGFLTSFPWAKYVLFLNTDLTVYLDGTPPIPGMTLVFSITVLAVYYSLFMASAWLVFNRRDVAS